MLAGLFFDAN